MNPATIALFVACVIGSSLALDCTTQIQTFHTCLETSHKTNEENEKTKFEAIKTQFEACYTSNGCTAPTKPQETEQRNHTESACGKALGEAIKQNIEACVQQAVPGFVFPPTQAGQEKGHRHHRFNHKEDNKALSGCAQAQAVRDCKRALINSTTLPSQADMKTQFQAACDAKQTCLTALGTDCQNQMEAVKKAMCTCRQQQREQASQIRSALPACKDGPSPPEHENENNKKVESCGDEKNYCQLGFDAMVAEFEAKKSSTPQPQQ